GMVHRRTARWAPATESFFPCAPAPQVAESPMPNAPNSLPSMLNRMLAKFRLRARLEEEDRRALLELPYRLQNFDPSKYLVREGSRAQHCTLIVSGFAIRHKLTVDGDRQIVSVHVPGDFV